LVEQADNRLDTFLENPYRSGIRFEPVAAQKERKMREIIFGTSLVIAFVATGCASSQLHQSLLLQENRQLEDALYAAHAQVADLKRENDWLRNKQDTEMLERPRRPDSRLLDEEFDLAPPYEMPKVLLPGTTEIPEALKGSQTMPIWRPRR